MKDNLVSVIMPAYNAEKYISEAIESVLAQTYADWELVIVDDCSKDKTAAIAQSYATNDSRIKLYKLKQNKGVANARNVAMEKAQGRYIAFLDSDDIWLPEKLAKQIEFMQKNKAAFTFHQYRYFDEKGVKEKLIDVQEKLSYKDALKGNSIGCLTVCIDRNLLNPFTMPQLKHEDYITWLNILKENNIYAYGIKEDLARYRIGNNDSVSSNKLKSALWTWRVYRESQKLGVIESLYYFINYIMYGLMKHKK